MARIRYGRTPSPAGDFAAFISYSRAVDGKLAPALQQALQAFAKPWYRLRALRIFRDDASLSANPGLWPSIQGALDTCEWFILLASPSATASPWVNREVEHWLSGHDSSRLIIAVTEGSLDWSSATSDFDWDVSDCLPRGLSKKFADEPRYVDLRWVRTQEHLSPRDPRFRDAVADIAAPLHGKPKDELVGEDVRQHRRTRRIARTAGAALATLAIGATALALVALDQRNEARSQRDRAEREARIANSRRLAEQGVRDLDQQLDRGVLESLLAYRLEPTEEARSAVVTALGRTARLRGVLRGHNEWVETVAFSPDGKLIASGGADDRVRLWDARSLRQVGPAHSCYCFEFEGLGFAKGGRRLVYPDGFDATEITFLDPARGTRAGPTMLDEDQVNGVALDPRGRWIVTYGEDRPISVFSARTRRLVRRLRVNGGLTETAAISRAGILAAGGQDGEITLVDLRRRGSPRVLRGHARGKWVNDLVFDRSGRRLVSGSEDTRILFWDVASGKRVGRPITQPDWVEAVALSPDGRLIASAGADGLVRLFSMESRTLVGLPLDGHERVEASEVILSAIAFSPNGRTLAAAGKDGNIRVWEVDSTPLAQSVPIGSVSAIAYDAAGRTLAAAVLERGVWVWRLDRPRDPPRLFRRTTEDYPRDVALSPDGGTLAVGYQDGTVTLWDVARRRARGRPLRAGAERALDVDFSPDGKLLATSGGDGRVTLWDARTGKLLKRPLVGGENTSVEPLAFSPDGRTLAAGMAGDAVGLWDVATRRVRRQLPFTIEGSLVSLAYSRDGSMVAAGGDDGRIRLWDARAPKPVAALLVGHGEQVESLAFSPDGRLLVSGATDGTLRLWDVASRRPLGEGLAAGDSVLDVAFSPDGRTLLSGSSSGIHEWAPVVVTRDAGALSARLCRVAGRDLTAAELAELLPGERQEGVC